MTYQIDLEVINEQADWVRSRTIVSQTKKLAVLGAKFYVKELEGSMDNLAVENVSDEWEIWTVVEEDDNDN